MRVTNTMMANNLLRNLWANMERLQEYQDQLASGKKIRRPSDDPVRATSSLKLRSSLGEIEQYSKNVEDAKTWLEVTDSALTNAIEVLQTARERAVAGANGTLPQESREAIAQEVAQLRDQLMQIANTNVGGRYIFGGTQTTKPPVGDGYQPVYWDGSSWKETGNWQGNEESVEYEIAAGVKVTVNTLGNKLFHGYTENDTLRGGAIAVLNELAKALEDRSKSGADISKWIGEIDLVLDKFIEEQGKLGAIENRMEMTANRILQQQIQQTDLLSQAEDADVAEAIINLKNQENAYRTTLAAGARIILPTLIDFLR
ncbi:MAG: flagellar hook-associated protein FlgL [Thermacetogeniaceae bacterium]